jgi:hypothetical protein
VPLLPPVAAANQAKRDQCRRNDLLVLLGEPKMIPWLSFLDIIFLDVRATVSTMATGAGDSSLFATPASPSLIMPGRRRLG